MRMKQMFAATATLGLALSLAACANDGLLGAVGNTTAALPEKPKVDPACAALAAKMDELRKDGVPERVEQASQGKGATVTVKRESLVKVSELNKVSTEFQSKCTTFKPAPAATLSPGAAPVKAAAPAKKVASAAPATASNAAADAAAKAKSSVSAPATAPSVAPKPEGGE